MGVESERNKRFLKETNKYRQKKPANKVPRPLHYKGFIESLPS
jgi:hypothetical protein